MARTPFAAVGKTTAVATSQLNTFHRNARRGDVAAIAASLKAHDQYKPITVNLGTHTGRPNEVLAGNHTLMAVRDLAERYPDDERWNKILVFWIDVDDDRCNRIVVADNRTSELGGMDTETLLGLLADMGDNLNGLGFTEADIMALNGISDELKARFPDVDTDFDDSDNDDDDDDDDFSGPVSASVTCPNCRTTFTPGRKADSA